VRDESTLDEPLLVPLALARPGLSLSLCASAGTEPTRQVRRWSVGHGDRSGAVGVMTSPDPLLPCGGSGRLDDWMLVSVQTLT